jgi:hypothetical protein
MTGFNLKGDPWIASASDLALPWACKAPGKMFRCAWCGHRFAVGDEVRCIFTNGPGDETNGIGGNPFVCAQCNAPRDELLARLRAMRAEVDGRLWWFLRHVRM